MRYEIIILCSICGFVWAEILTQPGHIFNGLFNWIDRTFQPRFAKPLGGCAVCVTGQIACWVGLYVIRHHYNPFHHIAFICTSIFITWIILKVQERL